ncbi:ribosomal L7Ae/L30e/S12e/Gadd45 family protein [Clostridium sp. 'deep sea']|uniref:L7Ae/L30e/S12e/Gadd45 family ribosomal protein n=1 Tax=Clostridium sp. 'deep sea' TaxID=2779445 RepID=UPI00189679C4|nr:ribosomal L7Ae/L30e/S12e/Gadd45 family protein [Clostridium sp. 'deep sea']QOR36021.1 ribosomal L7Ae/L30e/S12e/Gadd45 family protein [Clostridium sp. 'deep sea']
MSRIKDKYYSFLGIIKKTGKIIAGYDTVKDNFNKAKLIILAEDASDKMKQKMLRRCKEHNKELVCYGVSKQYGRALGIKDSVILAIIDKNFSEVLKSKFGFEVLIGGEKFGKS